MVIQRDKPTNAPFKIDWGKVWARKDDDPIPDLLIATTTSKMGSDWEHSFREELQKLSDGELEDKIDRMKNLSKTSCYRLSDKGEKLRRSIELLEEERESRKLRRIEKEATGCENLSQPTNSSVVGRERIASSSADSVSIFAARFNQKLEQKTERNNSAFGEELSILGHCDNRRQRSNGKLSPKVKQKGQTSSRQQPFKFVNSLSTDVHKNSVYDGDYRRLHPDDIALVHRMVKDCEPALVTKLQAQIEPSINHARQLALAAQQSSEATLAKATNAVASELSHVRDATRRDTREMTEKLHTLRSDVQKALAELCRGVHVACPVV